jgi:hypothetical protein
LLLESEIVIFEELNNSIKFQPSSIVMKTMTCKQLAGACEQKFSAETFEEIGEMCKEHSTEMFELGDEAHLQAQQEMMKLMQDPEAMMALFAAMRQEFDALPDDD